MTLNTVKPRSAITRLSPSMICATDLLLGLVITPSEDCVLSTIRRPFEVLRRCDRLREQVFLTPFKMRAARGERFHPPSGGASAQSLTIASRWPTRSSGTKEYDRQKLVVPPRRPPSVGTNVRRRHRATGRTCY